MFSQVKPSGYEGKFPLVVGAGLADYRLDWGFDYYGHRRTMFGETGWIDWNFYSLPRRLNGLGIEVELQDLSWGGPKELTTSYPGNNASMRHDTAAAGVIYTWRHWNRINPYGKFLPGFGSMDFPSNALRPDGTPYTHDTRTIYAVGGGANFVEWTRVAIRADYEYQFWPHFLGHPNPLNPSGFTLGATYNFTPFRKHGIQREQQ